MKLFYFEKSKNRINGTDFLKIKEAEIIKETEKTYVVKACYEHTIRKSEMMVWDYIFFKSYKEAVSEAIEHAEYCLKKNSERIKSLILENEKIITRIGELKRDY